MKFKGRVLVGLVSFVFCCAFAQQNVASKTFSVGCVNCGAFHYGGGRATPEEFSNEWQRLAKDFPQDAFFYSDVGKGTPGDISIKKFDIRADAKRKPVAFSEVRLPFCIETPNGIKKTKRNRALRLVYDLGGRTLAVYGLHLVAEGHISGRKVKGFPSLSQQLRRRQFEALLADARRFDYAIFAGDFNAQKPWEYDVFVKAGYRIGNCSAEYGTTATLRNIPADNIILSPGLAFLSFEVLKKYVLDTDHFPVVATVRLPDEVASITNSLPSVAGFLEKTTAERRALFKCREFRKKMFDANYPSGEGLLSRWTNVEKIPNLRDVGGSTKERVQTFLRSCGVTDAQMDAVRTAMLDE